MRESLVVVLIISALFAGKTGMTFAAQGTHDTWHDTFYQYRLPVHITAEEAGWHVVPLTEKDILSRINVREPMPYDLRWFAYNHLKAVETDASGRVLDKSTDAGFYLIVDSGELIDNDMIEAATEMIHVPVERGAKYLLSYTASGAGASPILGFKSSFPVMHPLSVGAFLYSFEPRMLPVDRTSREVMIVPNTATMPLHVKGRFVRGLERMSLRRAQVVFLARFDSPGTKHLELYYQPLTGHYLTVPEKRRQSIPGNCAAIDRIGDVDTYEGTTRYGVYEDSRLSVSFAETTVKITPEMHQPAQSRDKIRICAAANEKQSFQLVLHPRNDIHIDSISCSDITGKKGRIDGDHCSISRIAYVPITESSYLTPVHYLGSIGDPLLPATAETVSPLQGVVAYWCTVEVPRDSAAGTYTGNIKLSLESGTPITLPIELEVYDFALPEFSPFRSSAGGPHFSKVIGDAKTIADYHAVSSQEDIRQLSHNYFEYMSKHKFTPHNVMQYTPIGLEWDAPPEGYNVDAPENYFRLHSWDFAELDKNLTYFIDELKVNAFTLVHTNPSVITMFKHLPGEPLDEYNRQPPHSSLDWQNWREMTSVGYDKREGDDYIEITRKQFDNLVMQFYRGIAEHLEEKGWLDYAYILVDETAYRGYQPYIDFMTLLKSDPLTARIQFAWCIQGPAAFRHKVDGEYAFHDLVDIYIPETNENHHYWEKYFFSDYGIEFTRDNLWNYVTYTSRVAIDAPGINNRIIGMEVFNNGGGGFLMWATFIWDSKSHQESNHDNPWEQPWTRWGNGAMAYFYPPVKSGPAEQKTFDVVPSLRIEAYRESVDDFEYAYLLEQAIADAKSRGIDASEAQGVLDEIPRFFVNGALWSQNDAWYLELRDRIARAIVQLKQQ